MPKVNCPHCNRIMDSRGLAHHIKVVHLKTYVSPFKGQTCGTNASLKRMQEKLKGRSFGFGKYSTHTLESKKKISSGMMGNRNANHRGDRQSYYNGIRMDSSWECKTAEYFDSNGVDWKYSEKGYVLSDGRVYYPDFFIYENGNLDKIVEVKGYFREENRLKFEQFLSEYPQLKVELWNKKVLSELGII